MKAFTNFSRGVKKYSVNTIWNLVEKAVRVILGVTLMAWVIRYLGPKDYGDFKYAQSFVELLSGFFLMCGPHVLERDLIKHQKLKHTLLGSAFFLRGTGTLFMCILIGVSIYFMNNAAKHNLLIGVCVLHLMVQNFWIIKGYFNSKVLSKYIVYSNLTALAVCSLFRILLVLNQYSVIYFAWSFVLDGIIATFLYIYFYSKYEGSLFKWRVDFSIAKKLLLTSWPYLFSSIIILFYSRIDQVMLKSMIGSEAVGYYAAAIRICASCFSIPTLIVKSLFPAIINAQKKNQKQYFSRIQKLYELVVIVFLLICLPVMSFSDGIISLMYGESFAIAGQILSLYILSGLIIAIDSVRRVWMLSENLQRYDFIICIVGGILNVVFNLFLIGPYGIMGVVYGTLLAHMATFLTTGLMSKMRPSFFMVLKAFYNIFLLKFLRKEYFKNI